MILPFCLSCLMYSIIEDSAGVAISKGDFWEENSSELEKENSESEKKSMKKKGVFLWLVSQQH